MPSIRGIRDNVQTALKEDQALTAIIGAVGGAVGAFLAERYGPEADPEKFAITVDQARASLLSALALVFTGLSIVLALTALATGNMASKFSPRLLRMRLRGEGNKRVLAVFAATAAFIITSQVLLRTGAGDVLAPPLVMAISVLLLVGVGVMIVWYIDGTLQSMRVDRAISWIGRRIESVVKRQEHAARNDVVVDTTELQRPPDAIDLVAPDDGYVVSIDTGGLARLVENDERCIVLEVGTGHAVVRGECIGWMSAPVVDDDLPHVLDCLTIANARDPDNDIGYAIGVLVDIGLMALSAAVNDPRTGVECTEMLTVACTDLAGRDVGIRTRTRDDGSPSVIVIENTMGDYLDGAGRQILLYGADDRTVTAALLRLGRQCERAARSDRDRRLARAFVADVEAVRGADISEGRSW